MNLPHIITSPIPAKINPVYWGCRRYLYIPVVTAPLLKILAEYILKAQIKKKPNPDITKKRPIFINLPVGNTKRSSHEVALFASKKSILTTEP